MAKASWTTLRQLAGGVGRAAIFLPLLAGACQTLTPSPLQPRLDDYVTVELTTDLDQLTAAEREMLPLLIAAAEEMNGLFWQQAYGDRDELMDGIADAAARRLADINFGPWDRLNGNQPFIATAGEKPPGANFYPLDLTKNELHHMAAEDAEAFRQMHSQYTMVRRDAGGKLQSIPYHEHFAQPLARAAGYLEAAAELAPQDSLRDYLQLRAQALRSDDYRPSDMAWLDMKDNRLDCVIGPIETYEDQLLGAKAAFEAYVLVKDLTWSQRLERYAALLPELQRGLPVDDDYKAETPGTDSDLGAYDVVFYAGDCNAGSKTIAINLPNDEVVQLEKGTRRLQLKNAMRAKFDHIMVPLANHLISPAQRGHVTFDAFFANTMFHEVAHGLGIKNTLTGRGTVRQALKEQSSTLEEGKADILGLYMVTRLHQQGLLEGGDIRDYYVTFLAGIFRSVRFGASSAHGRANMLRFHFFAEQGAFARDPVSGRYRVDFPRMELAMTELAKRILTVQGDGDYGAARDWVEKAATITPELQQDLGRLADAGIPVDVVFEQGTDVLGL